jgi:ribosome maturation factor RimP
VGVRPTLLLSADGEEDQAREQRSREVAPVSDELQEAVAPVVEARGLELVDLELRPGLVRVVIDCEGGVDLDSVSDLTREISAVLDHHDPMPESRYTLEVSSPGLERPLRKREHFERAVGEEVVVRTHPSAELERRVRGTLFAADAYGIVLKAEDLPEDGFRVAYGDIERARTVFDWGPAPRPGSVARPKSRSTKPASAAGPVSKKKVAS